MSSDEESNNRAKAIVYEMLEELLGARNRFREEEFTNNGAASEEAYKKFSARIVQTADFLSQFSDENAVDDELFEEFDEAVERIKSRRGETVSIEVPAAGDTTATQSTGEEVPAILMLDAEWLIKVSKRAETICKSLGWGPSVKQETPHDEVTHDDLRGLVELRGQDKALESLPEVSDDGGD